MGERNIINEFLRLVLFVKDLLISPWDRLCNPKLIGKKEKIIKWTFDLCQCGKTCSGKNQCHPFMRKIVIFHADSWFVKPTQWHKKIIGFLFEEQCLKDLYFCFGFLSGKHYERERERENFHMHILVNRFCFTTMYMFTAFCQSWYF